MAKDFTALLDPRDAATAVGELVDYSNSLQVSWTGFDDSARYLAVCTEEGGEWMLRTRSGELIAARGFLHGLQARREQAAGMPALTLADAEADAAGLPRPDSPGLNTDEVVMVKAASIGKSETSVAMQAKPSVDMAQQVRDREVSGRALGAALGAGAAQLSIGRLVHYALSLDDAAKINGRRTDGAAIQDRILEDRWPIGAQAHIGNRVAPGDVLPAMVVRVLPGDQVNLQVFLDGNDVFWATTRAEAAPGRTEPGRWHWPARA